MLAVLAICGLVWSDRVERLNIEASLASARAGAAPIGGRSYASDTPKEPASPPSTSTVSETPTTTTKPALPVPAPLPLDPYADTPEIVVARIVIPAIGLDEEVHQGMTLTAINRGPSHWPGTALPGQMGNVVIAGHRTTYSKPFRNLDQLQAGDRVIYRTDAGTFTYAVSRTDVVTPDEVHIADQTEAYTSTLFACHPPGSAAYRIVVRLQMLDPPGVASPVDATATPTVSDP